MPKYIDIEKRMKQWENLKEAYCPNSPCYRFEDFIIDTPAEDVVNVKHGKWIDHFPYLQSVECSVCKKTSMLETKYCAYCGACMDGMKQKER